VLVGSVSQCLGAASTSSSAHFVKIAAQIIYCLL